MRSITFAGQNAQHISLSYNLIVTDYGSLKLVLMILFLQFSDLTTPLLVQGKTNRLECLVSDKFDRPTNQLTLSRMQIYFDQEPFAQESMTSEENDSN